MLVLLTLLSAQFSSQALRPWVWDLGKQSSHHSGLTGQFCIRWNFFYSSSDSRRESYHISLLLQTSAHSITHAPQSRPLYLALLLPGCNQRFTPHPLLILCFSITYSTGFPDHPMRMAHRTTLHLVFPRLRSLYFHLHGTYFLMYVIVYLLVDFVFLGLFPGI